MGRNARDNDNDHSAISIHPSRVGWDPHFPGTINLIYIFQSTHPVWDGTDLWDTIKELEKISIHPSRVGWDVPDSVKIKDDIVNFNPPIPCGMGHFAGLLSERQELISIHPSRVGWDFSSLTTRKPRLTFQSTHPVWDGTVDQYVRCYSKIFQSTHPVWDGTSVERAVSTRRWHFNPPIPCGMGLFGAITKTLHT